MVLFHLWECFVVTRTHRVLVSPSCLFLPMLIAEATLNMSCFHFLLYTHLFKEKNRIVKNSPVQASTPSRLADCPNSSFGGGRAEGQLFLTFQRIRVSSTMGNSNIDI